MSRSEGQELAARQRASANRGDRALRFRKGATPYLFLAPTILLMLVIQVYPLLASVVLSTFRWVATKPYEGIRFIAGGNFLSLLTDPTFWDSIRVTVVFMAGSVAAEMVLGMGLALFLNRQFLAKGVIRSVFLLPMMMAPVAVGLIWVYMWEAQFGVVNYFLSLVGIKGPEWVASTTWALPAVMITDVWRSTPFVFLVLLAGLQAIPDELYDAAKVDGANRRQVFQHVTVPLLMPVLLVVLVVRLMDAFRAFGIIYTITDGGPSSATTTVMYHQYVTSFRVFDIGKGSAIAVIITVMILAMSWYFMRYLRHGLAGEQQ